MDNFFFWFTLRCKQSDIVPIICKLTADVVDTGGNLPLVSCHVVLRQFAASVNETSRTGGKFTVGVVDTGGKFATDVVDTAENLLLLSLIPVVHRDLRIFSRIFENILNDNRCNFQGLGGR
jgi:hypothetical protein